MVVIDSRKRRDGAAIEQLGWYNPIDINHSFELNQDRILHWLGEGAEPTDAAKKLLRNEIERTTMRQAARSEAERWGWAGATKQLRNYYENVLSKNRSNMAA